LLQSVKKLEVYVGGELVKRLMYVIPLSALAVLAFAAIAAAQPAAVPAETTAPAESTTPAPNSPTTVEIRDHAFNPPQLNVAPGTTVRFVNNETEPHTATADNGAFDTGVLQPGYSMDVFLDGSGTLPYHCELHPDMQGSIVVGEAGEAEGTTTENPTSDPTQTTSDDPKQTVSATQNMPGSDSTQSS
jgi:plastocyanin